MPKKSHISRRGGSAKTRVGPFPRRGLGCWRAMVALLAALAWASPAAAQQGDFFRQQIPLERELGEVFAHHLTSRTRKDLVVLEVERATRANLPYLKVFTHLPQGFGPLPSATAALPPGLSLAGVGEFPFGSGLVLLFPNRVEIWPWREGRFAPQQAMRGAVQNIFLVPGGGLEKGLQLAVDLDGDGFDELVIPRMDGFQVLRVTAQGQLEVHATLRTRTHRRLWSYLRRNYIAYELPAVRFVDADGRGWKDLLVFNDGLVSLFLLDGTPKPALRGPELEQDLQPPGAFDPQAPRDPPMKLVMGRDLNGDGLPDLVFTKNKATDSSFRTATWVLIFFGTRGGETELLRFGAKPDQVFASEGFTHPILLDLNRDKLVDMVLVNIEVGFWTAVRAFIARSVTAEAAFYLMQKEGRFPNRPQGLVGYGVKFSLQRYGHQPIAAFADLNSDGLPELLLSEDKENLGIHWGLPGNFWQSGYDFLLRDSLPINTRGLRVTDLDGDGREDLLLVYERADIRQMPEVHRKLTVLLSRFPRRGNGLAASR